MPARDRIQLPGRSPPDPEWLYPRTSCPRSSCPRTRGRLGSCRLGSRPLGSCPRTWGRLGSCRSSWRVPARARRRRRTQRPPVGTPAELRRDRPARNTAAHPGPWHACAQNHSRPPCSHRREWGAMPTVQRSDVPPRPRNPRSRHVCDRPPPQRPPRQPLSRAWVGRPPRHRSHPRPSRGHAVSPSGAGNGRAAGAVSSADARCRRRGTADSPMRCAPVRPTPGSRGT